MSEPNRRFDSLPPVVEWRGRGARRCRAAETAKSLLQDVRACWKPDNAPPS
jgi:hypothetical protein